MSEPRILRSAVDSYDDLVALALERPEMLLNALGDAARQRDGELKRARSELVHRPVIAVNGSITFSGLRACEGCGTHFEGSTPICPTCAVARVDQRSEARAMTPETISHAPRRPWWRRLFRKD